MTIKDIAKLSGYGVSTVSRALNGHPDINSDTKAKIDEIVKKYNYIPNKNARQLKRSTSNSILILVKGNMNMFFTAIIEHIQSEIEKNKITATVSYIGEQDNEVLSAIELTNEIKPLGIIFLGANFEYFEESFSQISIPAVITSTTSGKHTFNNLSTVSIDDVDAGYKAINYLVSQGHRKIGILCGDFDTSNPSKQRLEGCKKSIKENNINLLPSYIEKCSYNISSAYDATMTLLQRQPDITAIFAMSDAMAIGTIRAISDMKKRVPDDISVLGFDGTEMASYYLPRITTMSQPAEKLASLSVRVLMNMINDNNPGSDVLLQVTLKNGESVKAI